MLINNEGSFVHANTPQRAVPFEGSHGQSRIVDPNGVLLKESPIFGEDILIETLDLTTATGGTAAKSLNAGFLNSWWVEGLDLVQVIE